MKSRLIGIAAIAIGVGFGWFFILQPLASARAHAPMVQYSIKAFLFVTLATTAGFALLLGGDRVLAAFSGPPRGRDQIAITMIVFAIGAVASLAGWWWFDNEMTALGYGNR